MEMFDIISTAAVVAYFVPLVLVLVKKLWNDRFFLLFALYWASAGLINITDFIGISKNANIIIGILYNMIDIPVIMAIFYTTTASLVVRRYCIAGGLLSLATTITGIAINGFNYDALKYSLGVGIALVLVVLIWEVIRYLQTIEHSNRQNAKIFIYAALLFEYASFILIYVFDYFVDAYNQKDNFLIYYISSLVAIFIASCGFLLFKKYEKNSMNYSHFMD